MEGVKILLRAYANPLLSAYGSLPLYMAVYDGHQKVVRELVHWYGTDRCTSDGGALALATAASRKHVDIVTFLCDAGVVDTEGVALCAVIEGCSEACVYLLLRRRGEMPTRVRVPTSIWTTVLSRKPMTNSCTQPIWEAFMLPDSRACYSKPGRTRHWPVGFRTTVMRGKKTKVSSARP
ncbi:unnamed protein product [Pylaiella littoralis]